MENPKQVAEKLLTNHTVIRWEEEYAKEYLNEDKTWYKEVINPNFKNSIYVEDGDLIETNLIQVHELDMEGKYIVGFVGFFRVKPKYFDVTINKTFDNEKTFYNYRLNEYGREQLGKKGLKDFGFLKITLITKRDLERIITDNKSQISAITLRNSKHESLLNSLEF